MGIRLHLRRRTFGIIWSYAERLKDAILSHFVRAPWIKVEIRARILSIHTSGFAKTMLKQSHESFSSPVQVSLWLILRVWRGFHQHVLDVGFHAFQLGAGMAVAISRAFHFIGSVCVANKKTVVPILDAPKSELDNWHSMHG